jgi:hypothetical protein
MAEEYIITAEMKLACVTRELKLREHVYPRRVANGQMTQQLADRETRTMRAIVDEYEKFAAGERLL